MAKSSGTVDCSFEGTFEESLRLERQCGAEVIGSSCCWNVVDSIVVCPEELIVHNESRTTQEVLADHRGPGGTQTLVDYLKLILQKNLPNIQSISFNCAIAVDEAGDFFSHDQLTDMLSAFQACPSVKSVKHVRFNDVDIPALEKRTSLVELMQNVLKKCSQNKLNSVWFNKDFGLSFDYSRIELIVGCGSIHKIEMPCLLPILKSAIKAKLQCKSGEGICQLVLVASDYLEFKQWISRLHNTIKLKELVIRIDRPIYLWFKLPFRLVEGTEKHIPMKNVAKLTVDVENIEFNVLAEQFEFVRPASLLNIFPNLNSLEINVICNKIHSEHCEQQQEMAVGSSQYATAYTDRAIKVNPKHGYSAKHLQEQLMRNVSLLGKKVINTVTALNGSVSKKFNLIIDVTSDTMQSLFKMHNVQRELKSQFTANELFFKDDGSYFETALPNEGFFSVYLRLSSGQTYQIE